MTSRLYHYRFCYLYIMYADMYVHYWQSMATHTHTHVYTYICTHTHARTHTHTHTAHTDSAVILVESTHLQRVKNLIWEVRVQWRALAGALGVSHDTVEEICHDLQCRNDGDRLEVVLTEWMRGGSATVHDLLTALSHHTVNGGHVSRQLRALQGEARLVLGLCETDCSLCLS